jgi:putative transcriptional regulator
VILNRSRDVKLASVLSGNPHAAKVAAPVRYGGPLGSKLVYAMVRRDPGEGAKRLLSDVFITTGGATIERIVARMPDEARFFTGMVVWLPGELETQIEAGEWIVTDADASMVFHRNPDAMWSELVARLGKTALK